MNNSLLCNCATPSLSCVSIPRLSTRILTVLMDEAGYIACRPLARAGHLFVDGSSASSLNTERECRFAELPSWLVPYRRIHFMLCDYAPSSQRSRSTLYGCTAYPAQVISSLLASLRIDRARNVAVTVLPRNLVPYPRIHFMLQLTRLLLSEEGLSRTVVVHRDHRACPSPCFVACRRQAFRYMTTVTLRISELFNDSATGCLRSDGPKTPCPKPDCMHSVQVVSVC